MKQKIWILFLLGGLIFVWGCGHRITPQSTQLNLSFSGEVPSLYDCNNQSRFKVSFKPYNNPGLTGDYLKMFFRLQIDTVLFYESNDIDFPLSTDTIQDKVYTLEFGGAIEGKYLRPGYQIVGYLLLIANGQIDTLNIGYTESKYLSVIPKYSFSKTMHIEYDCQNTYGLSGGTFEKLASAFHIADTDTNFLYNELNMLPVDIPYDDLAVYSVNHLSHTPGYNMHLLAVKSLTNNTRKIAGYSTPGGAFGFSFIFVKDIIDFNPIDPLYVIDKATIHELGHQRGGLRHASGPDNPHPEDHDSPFCVMNEDNSCSGNNDNNPTNDPPGLVRWFITNPHFCPNCVNTLRNISW